MLLLLAASCQLVGSDKPCSGAAGIDSLQAERLACVGWLDYVEAHTCRIDYVDIVPSEQLNTAIYGRANCRDRSMIIARRRADILGRIESIGFGGQIITMVHEAAHLEDRCRNGEPPAVAAENAYVADYERHREEESAIIMERMRSGNMNFDDLCLLTVYVVPGDP